MQEALDLAATPGTRFDLLLTDIRLPDGNGWELLRRLEKAGMRPQEAIAISETHVTESKGASFRAHLVKPITERYWKQTCSR